MEEEAPPSTPFGEATTPFLSASNYRDLDLKLKPEPREPLLKEGEVIVKHEGRLMTAEMESMDIDLSGPVMAGKRYSSTVQIKAINPRFFVVE